MNTPLAPEATDRLTQIAPSLHFLARRRMLLPLLLFVSAHRPLAFVIGQSLWLCSPVELLLPGVGIGDWAALLSHPHGGALLERMLEDVLVRDPGEPVEALP